MSESDFHTAFSHPSFGWASLPVINHSGAVWISQVLLIISLYTCHAFKHRQILQNLTLTILLCWLPSSRQRRHLLLPSNDAKTASEMCVSPVTYTVLCVRFVFFVRICCSRNRLQRSAEDATLDTGGWLNLMKLIQ